MSHMFFDCSHYICLLCMAINVVVMFNANKIICIKTKKNIIKYHQICTLSDMLTFSVSNQINLKYNRKLLSNICI